MKITTLHDLAVAYRTSYAWPGGYALHLILADGAALCRDCFRSEYKYIADDLRANYNSGWRPVALEVLWEGPPEYCANCSAEIPTEYGDPDS